MSLVLGIDSSTQSCKALLVDADSGHIVDQGHATHPAGTQVDPRAWVTAMEQATAGLLERADAVSVAGQQHGMVALDDHGGVVRNAMLWNDTSSAQEAVDLIAELGGAQAAADLIGSVPVASLTGTKLRWLRNNEPDNADRVSTVLLPHDYLTWHLGGRQDFTTDHGDASGTGYYSTTRREFLPELAEQFLGRPVALPRIAEPHEVVGRTSTGALIGAGTGDNMAAALGLDLTPGDVCVSLGTSGVVSAVVDTPVHDGTGSINGFSDATGRYLPLACTINGALVMNFAVNLLGVDHAEFAELALAGQPGAGGLSLLPYFDGERTPNRPNATGVLRGLTTSTTREDVARATVEGILCSLRDGISALQSATGASAEKILFIGGGARSRAIRTLAPTIFGAPVVVPEPGEYVALGAARQAAWALSGNDTPPEWGGYPAGEAVGETNDGVVASYRWLRDATESW